MKLVFTFLLIVTSFLSGVSQTFTNSTGGAIPDAPPNGVGTLTCFPVTVSGVGNINGTYGLSGVCMTITHTWVEDLQIYLEAPDGMRIYLVSGNGGDGGTSSGVNFTNTCFSQTAATSIATITPAGNPYTNTFTPLTSIGYVNNGQNANGVWRLCCQDLGNMDAGNLINFSITFSATPATPVTICNNTPLAGNRCDNPTPICLGIPYCGITGPSFSVDTFAGLTAAFKARAGAAAEIEGNGFYKFVANATTANIAIRSFSTINTTPDKSGIEVLVMNNSCTAPVTTYAYTGFIAPSATATNIPLTGLVPGNQYLIMVDGADGDISRYIFQLTAGANVYNVTPIFDTVCSGSSTTLTASGGDGTYTWSPATGLSATTGASVTASQVVAAPSNVTYTVTYGTIAGLTCPVNTRTTVVRYVPTPTATAPANICMGNSAILSPVGGGTWSTSAPSIATINATTGVVTTVSPGTVTFTFIDTNMCSATTPLVTITPPTITPTFTPVAPFCAGTTAPILPTTSNNGITGTWSPAMVSNSASATYTFTPTVGQCSNTATMSITVNPLVTPTFTAIAPFCSGSVAPVLPPISNNGITGTWAPLTISNTTSGTYTFTPANGQCASTTTLNTTVSPILTPTVTCGSSTVNSVTFNWTSVSGAVDYSLSYTINGGAAIIVPGTTTLLTYTVTGLTVNDNVQLTVTPNGTGGCFASGNTTCTAVACVAPTLNINTPTTLSQTVCVNSAIATISFNVGGTATSASASGLPPGVTGTYNAGVFTITGTPTTVNNFSYTVITTGGCSASPSITANITVNAPVTPIFAAVAAFCSGTTAPVLPTTSINGFTGTWSPAVSNTASGTYTFTPIAGQCATIATLALTVTTPTAPTFTAVAPICIGATAPVLPTTSNNGITGSWFPASVSNIATATYTFTPTAGQCASTTTITVTVNPGATPTFNAITPFCANTTAPALSNTSNNGIIGTWSPAIVSNLNTAVYTFTPNPGQCASATTLPVIVIPQPTVNLGNDTVICTPNSLVLNATNLLSTYTWQDGSTNATFNITTAGTYSVIVTNALGCTNADAINVGVSSLATFNLGRDTVLCPSQSITLNSGLSVMPGLNLLWQDGSTSPNYVATIPGTYFLDATNYCGTFRDELIIGNGVCKVYVPNAFTPNNDGRNDLFRPLGTELITKIDVKVFSRWGQMVFATNKVGIGWNGKFEGTDLPTGTYVYYVTYTEPTTLKEVRLKGTLMLLR